MTRFHSERIGVCDVSRRIHLKFLYELIWVAVVHFEDDMPILLAVLKGEEVPFNRTHLEGLVWVRVGG